MTIESFWSWSAREKGFFPIILAKVSVIHPGKKIPIGHFSNLQARFDYSRSYTLIPEDDRIRDKMDDLIIGVDPLTKRAMIIGEISFIGTPISRETVLIPYPGLKGVVLGTDILSKLLVLFKGKGDYFFLRHTRFNDPNSLLFVIER